MIDIKTSKTLEPEWMKSEVEAIQRKINNHINKTLDQRQEYIEMMAMAYLKLTDIHPSEVELVEDRSEPLVTRWYFRRKQ